MKLEFIKCGSADAPLVRIYQFDPHQIERLLQSFRQLADGSIDEILVHRLPGVESIENCHLTCRLWNRDKGVSVIVASSLECKLTHDGWRDVAERTAPFAIDQSQGGHQWLNECGDISLLLSDDGTW
jgi:hypothetical protein